MEYENQKLKEFEEYIKFRKIAVIGLGVSNLPLIDYLYEKRQMLQYLMKEILNKFQKMLWTK